MSAAGTGQVRELIRRHLSLGLAVVVLLGTAYVLSNVGDEGKRLTIAVKQGVEGVALKEIAQNFSKHKHVSVEVVELPYDELYEEEQRQLNRRPLRQRDAVPPFDVIMVDDPWLYSLVYSPDGKELQLENLTSALKEKDADFFKSTLRVAQYCPSAESCSVYFAIPFVANSQLFAYRASDFAKLGTQFTWEQVSATATAAENRGSIGYVTRIGLGNSIVTDFMPILWAYDPASFPEYPTHEPPLNHPDSAFTTLTTLVGTRKNLGSASFDDFDVSAYLQRGRASMGIVWSAWALMLADTDSTARELTSHLAVPTSERIAKLKDSLLSQPQDDGKGNEDDGGLTRFKEKLSFGQMPSGVGRESQPELGVWLLAIPIKSDQRELALDFIKYATDLSKSAEPGTGGQTLVAAQRGTPPPRRSVLAILEEEPKFKNEHPSLIPAIRWSLENARARPRTPCWKTIESRLGTYLETILAQPPNTKPATTKPVTTKDLVVRANLELERLFDEQDCRILRKTADTEIGYLEHLNAPPIRQGPSVKHTRDEDATEETN